jgi:hypothetical protein
MTEKQIERVKTKIKLIKSALAADKRKWGGFYDDSRGLRYAPPELYIKIGDFSGGLRYMNWFNKNFPDDFGLPEFMLEWTIILFKTGRLREAEKKAFQTFCRNTYVFDAFFKRPITPTEKWEGSSFETAEFIANSLRYSHAQDDLTDFSLWLSDVIQGEKFQRYCASLLDLEKRLKTEHHLETRTTLVRQIYQLEDDY